MTIGLVLLGIIAVLLFFGRGGKIFRQTGADELAGVSARARAHHRRRNARGACRHVRYDGGRLRRASRGLYRASRTQRSPRHRDARRSSLVISRYGGRSVPPSYRHGNGNAGARGQSAYRLRRRRAGISCRRHQARHARGRAGRLRDRRRREARDWRRCSSARKATFSAVTAYSTP